MKFFFQVFGCRLNQAEAASWQAALEAQGHSAVSKDEADILCIHSCAVTEPAVKEVAKLLRSLRARRPDVKIVLSGCATDLLPESLADLRIPHDRKAEWIPQVLSWLTRTAPFPQMLPEFVPFSSHSKTRTSLIVQDGCDRFCTYCIVPYMRGVPTSEPMSSLLREAEARFAAGYREIVLTGCHLALYRDPETGAGLTELLRRLCDVRGEGRFRISSLEPCVSDDADLIRLIARSGGRICDFLHLPLQSASDTVLERMERTYRATELHQLFELIGEYLPQAGLGADWIVGFPGETEADAAATRAFVERYPFTGAHVFPYSRRPGTPAAEYDGQLPAQTIHARAARLSEIAKAVAEKRVKDFLFKPLTVIPERLRDGCMEGWSSQRIRCRLPASAQRGCLTPFVPIRAEGTILL